MFSIQQPHDGGTVYAETNLSNFFPEPLNGIKAVFSIYWTYKLWGEFKSHKFLTYSRCPIKLKADRSF